MALIAAHDLGLALGGPPLLDGATFQIEKGDRIGLVGRNGTGKSTLLAVLADTRLVDSGTLDRQPGLRVALLPQEVPQGLAGTVAEAVAAGVDLHPGEEPWGRDQRVTRTLTRLRLPADDPVDGLSGGMLRRVMLARALAAEPDILLLDEPTNHLDIETITWLEEVLGREIPTLVMVTHDRALLRNLCTRVFELDRGRLLDFPGGYDDFVEHRDELLKAESLAWQRLDRKLAEEEVWIRQGIKARRTRNEGRVRALERLREERRERRQQPGAVRLELAAAERGGRLVIRAETSPSATATGRWSATSRPPSCAATASASSAPTARARPPCSSCCSASSPRRQAPCASARMSRPSTSTSCASNSTPTSPCATTSASTATRW